MAIFNNWAHASYQLLDMNICNQCQEVLQVLVSLPLTVTVHTTNETEASAADNLSILILSLWSPWQDPIVEHQHHQVVLINLLLLRSHMQSARAV